MKCPYKLVYTETPMNITGIPPQTFEGLFYTDESKF